jgi:selenoprotein W-related protein
MLETYKRKIESLELIPSSGGCFELTVDGELVYSKLETGSFPNEIELTRSLGKRAAAVRPR